MSARMVEWEKIVRKKLAQNLSYHALKEEFYFGTISHPQSY